MSRKEFERRGAEMRARLTQQRRQVQADRLLAINPHREAVLRNREAVRQAAAVAAGKERMTPDQLQAARREATSFGRMEWYLKRQTKALSAERQVTAYWGCKTSWARIEECAKYYVYRSNKSNGGRRTERPEHRVSWDFNPYRPITPPLRNAA